MQNEGKKNEAKEYLYINICRILNDIYITYNLYVCMYIYMRLNKSKKKKILPH